jgi:hypothetical protein
MISKKILIILFLLLFILTFGCANRQMTGDSLLVDDFNDGIDPNQLGGFIFVYAHKGATCTATYYPIENSSLITAPYCLEISWQVPIASNAGCGFNTRVLDVTRANYLKLLLKLNSNVNGIQLAIKDMNEKELKQPLAKYVKNNENWQEVIIPLSDYKGLDFTRIKAISLTFSPHTPEGSMLIDNILFSRDQ